MRKSSNSTVKADGMVGSVRFSGNNCILVCTSALCSGFSFQCVSDFMLIEGP